MLKSPAPLQGGLRDPSSCSPTRFKTQFKLKHEALVCGLLDLGFRLTHSLTGRHLVYGLGLQG